MAIYPERMRTIDPSAVEDSLVTIEKYIEYMRQRGEFAFGKVANISAEIELIEETIDNLEQMYAALNARVRALESR